MSLPSFELPSAFDKQIEFWLFKKFHWYDDQDCQGLYFQKCPLPYLFLLFDAIKRRGDRREAAKLVVTFDHLLTPMETTQTQRDAHRVRGDYKNRGGINWVSGLTWWQELPRMTIQDRADRGDSCAKYELHKGDWESFEVPPLWWDLPSISIYERSLMGDNHINYEILKGDWD